MGVGGDDTLLLGAGESVGIMATNMTLGGEDVHIGAETNIYMHVSTDNWATWTGRKTFSIDAVNGPLWAGGKDLVLRIIGAIGTDGALGHSLEMDGEAIERLGLEDRLTMANMAVEAGAVNGIIAPSEAVLATMRECAQKPFTPAYSDPDALYERHITLDVNAMPPQVAMPFSPGNVVGVDEVPMVRVDQVVIGSCTNGRISDLRNAARVLAGNKVAKGLRLLITPASPAVYNQALSEGLIAIFMRSGAVIMPPGCGVCFGGHMGVLGPGEVCVSTTNRNFKGRMGHVQSRVYLASPAVAAASAVRGIICHPEDVLGG